jgi:hypothetical protein
MRDRDMTRGIPARSFITTSPEWDLDDNHVAGAFYRRGSLVQLKFETAIHYVAFNNFESDAANLIEVATQRAKQAFGAALGRLDYGRVFPDTEEMRNKLGLGVEHTYITHRNMRAS